MRPETNVEDEEIPQLSKARRLEFDNDLSSTLRSAPDRVKRPDDKWEGLFLRHLVGVSLLAVVPAAVGTGLTASVWVGSAVPGLSAARSEMNSTEAAYHDALRSVSPAIQELASLGAPKESLETVYFSFADARTDDAERHQADILLGTLVDQSHIVGGGSRVGVHLSRSDAARRRASEAWHHWEALTRRPAGRAAVAVGLAAGPGPELDLYQVAHPRDVDADTVASAR